MAVFLPAILFCFSVVFLLSLLTIFLILLPASQPHTYHMVRDTRPITEVFSNNMVDTKIRETAIDCEVEMEKRRGHSGRTDQVLKAIGKGKGEYED